MSGPIPLEISFKDLLSWYRKELPDTKMTQIEDAAKTDPRLKAHLESIRYLDLEELAADADAAELSTFEPTEGERRYCEQVAATGGDIFIEHFHGNNPPNASWSKHVDGCTYCRRMHRVKQAESVRLTTPGFDPDEKLLREEVLDYIYLPALKTATEKLMADAERRKKEEPVGGGKLGGRPVTQLTLDPEKGRTIGALASLVHYLKGKSPERALDKLKLHTVNMLKEISREADLVLDPRWGEDAREFYEEQNLVANLPDDPDAAAEMITMAFRAFCTQSGIPILEKAQSYVTPTMTRKLTKSLDLSETGSVAV